MLSMARVRGMTKVRHFRRILHSIHVEFHLHLVRSHLSNLSPSIRSLVILTIRYQNSMSLSRFGDESFFFLAAVMNL
jgi:hypothetical protein